MRNTKAALLWITDILNKMDIPFEVDGGLAAHLYGAKRDLADIDINIPLINFYQFIPLVKNYITFGPKKYKDEHWDDLMISLKYAGQNIDICALGEMRYYDTEHQKWIDFPSELSDVRLMKYENIELPVINEIKLMIYKKVLNRGVDKKDVSAMLKNLFS